MSKANHATMKDYVDLGYKVAEWLGSAPRENVAGEMKAIAQREAKRVMKKETEFKVFDTTTTALTIGTTPTIANQTAIPQGVSDNQRTGDEVRIHRIRLKIAVFNAAAARSQQIRFVLARFKAAATAAPYPLASSFFNVAVSNPVLDFETHDQRALWHVLWDQSFEMSDTGSNRGWVIDKDFNVNSRIDFDAGLATGIGHYFLLVVGSDNTNLATYQSNCRVTYSNA